MLHISTIARWSGKYWGRLTFQLFVDIIEGCESALNIQIELDGVEEDTLTFDKGLPKLHAFLYRIESMTTRRPNTTTQQPDRKVTYIKTLRQGTTTTTTTRTYD